jgi:metallophosphoesterase (TIGR00282 family)
MSELKILFIADIVGSSGVYCVKEQLPLLKQERGVDFVIANAEGTTGGFGLGKNHSIYLHKLGINCLTGGECIYYKKDMVPHLEKASYIVRPANLPYENPGRGWRIFKAGERKIAVINFLGQYGFNRAYPANPFRMLDHLLEKIKNETDLIIIDFHALATAEKNTMFHLADGKVSAVIGTHTKVQTADSRIMPNGTAVVTGIGRTGSFLSVGGFEPEIEINKLITQIPVHSKIAWEQLEFQGALITLNDDGRAVAFELLKLPCKPAPDKPG